MSRATMLARAAELPRAPIYGVGRYRVGEESFDFEVGWPELDRDTAWVTAHLRHAGLTAGDAVLTTALSCEGPWMGPVVRALRALRVTFLPAEVYAFDAGRSAAMLQQFDISAVIGLGAETLSGWSEKNLMASDLLQGVGIVWARPTALAGLTDVRASVAPIVRLGPALAMGLPGEVGAVVNGAEWALGEHDGSLLVSSVAERASSFVHAPTGVSGSCFHVNGELRVKLVD